MITTRFYLDTRGREVGAACPLRLSLGLGAKRAYIALNVSLLPEHWDARAQMVVRHPGRVEMNRSIMRHKLAIDDWLFDNQVELAAMSLAAVRQRVAAVFNAEPRAPVYTPFSCIEAVIKDSVPGSARLRSTSLGTLMKFCPEFASLSFAEVDFAWMQGYAKWLRGRYKTNTVANKLSLLQRAFNYALDQGYTQDYPFRKISLKRVPGPKRALSVEQLRRVATMPVSVTNEKWRDMWMLVFYLIGINVKDLCYLKSINNGRIEYARAKTKRLYSIKVEPEAMALFEKYRGRNHLLWPMDTNCSYRNWARNFMRGLQLAAKAANGCEGAVQLPEITSYWARHSWATIAASLDIPKETIAAALGHGGNTVTDIYIDFDQRKVDEANRRVIDWVLYNKR